MKERKPGLAGGTKVTTTDNTAPRWTWPFLCQIGLAALAVVLSSVFCGKMEPFSALFVQGIVLTSTMIWFLRAVKIGYVALPNDGVLLLAGSFFALLAISGANSVNLHSTILGILQFASYMLLFVMIAGLSGRRVVIFAMIGVALLSGMLVAAIGMREYMANAMAGMYGWRTFATFFNPDFFAGMMVLLLPIALAWYVSKTSPGVTFVTAIGSALMLAGVAVSGSRFGAAAAFFGVLIFLVFAIRSGAMRRTQWIRIAPIILLFLVMGVLVGKPLMARVVAFRSEAHSGNFRVYTWKGTIKMAEAHPLYGTGLGTFDVAYPQYGITGYTMLAHNTYLQVASETGPLSTVVLLALLGFALYPVGRALVRGDIENTQTRVVESNKFVWIPEHGLMLAGLLGGASASIIRNAMDSDWYVMAIGTTFWVLLGAAFALGAPNDRRRIPATHGAMWAAASLAALLVIATVPLALGSLCLEKAHNYVYSQDIDSGIDSCKAATALDPLDPESHRLLGGIYTAKAVPSDDRTMFDKAEHEFQEAIRLEPTSGRNYYRLGREEQLANKDLESIQAFQNALKVDRQSPQTMLALAQEYDKMEQFDKALELYRRMTVVEKSPYETTPALPGMVAPEYVFAHEALGRDYESKGDIGSALREYHSALDRIDRFQQSMDSMGQMLAIMGRRNADMENKVAELKATLTEHVAQLEKHSAAGGLPTAR